ncbi:delta and Notch-like epidermal growth factor-related receptor [Juglans microcarpa x Juglans regia]|uniref:delta and Notch-like epidermal growth factor-related receptor n=1 Tax=Juglans microcarpa x Juglans regia TaxID=2249226 RepID=UPI001B7E20D5|nr:delta and Notch-like epidermal growth factor-related receptor [Juglans microcarpa x Juglans regia]
MEIFSLKLITLIHFHLLLFTLLICCNLRATSAQLIPNPLQVCALINCGEGTCKASNASVLGFDCECNPGWKKMQLGPLTFPSCVVPNCTVDFQCGKGSTSPPPPPAPLVPPPLNLSNPCALVWCGDGTCVTNGTGYTCECNEGSQNLLNLKGNACFKQCYLGADCNSLGFGPAPSPSASPRSTRPTGVDGGSSEAPICLRSLHALTTIILALIFLPWTN